MKCKTCSHPSRLEIDREIIQNGNISSIARKYGLTPDNISYHAQHHLSYQLATVYNKRAEDSNLDLLNKIDKIVIRAEKIFRRNYEVGQDNLALKALAEQRQTFELLAKISAYLHQVKAMENDQAREEEEEIKKEALVDSLQVLNDAELSMFNKILKKVEEQDKTMIIIPNQKLFVPSDTKNDQKMKRTRPVIRAEQQPAQEEINPYAVRPIKGREISVGYKK